MAGNIIVLYVGNKTSYKLSTNTIDYTVDKIHTKISINELSQAVIDNIIEI